MDNNKESNKVSIQVSRKIYDNSNGAYIVVEEDNEGLGMVTISIDDYSRAHFGECHITVTVDMARAIARALTLTADEMG